MIIAITAEKGGVGKTTSTINIGSYFALKGYKTLLIDFDQQANATRGVFRKGVSHTIYDALASKVKFSEIIQKQGDVNNLYVAPGSAALAELEVPLVSNLITGPYRLRRLIEDAQIRQDYDFIIIDSSPSMGIFTMNVMTCSDFLLIPMEGGDLFSFDGVDKVLKSYRAIIEERTNPTLKILGGFFNKMDTRLSIVQVLEEETRKKFEQNNIHLFKQVVHSNVRIKEAHWSGKPIYIHDPGSTGAQDFAALSEEILQRVTEMVAPARG